MSKQRKILQQVEDDEEEYESSRDVQTPELNFKVLSKDASLFIEEVSELNERACLNIRQSKQKEALVILQQAERMLEFAASCGRAIDRNLIVVVLYNEACAFQGQWVLDKCSKYIDGVIYNMEISLEEEVETKECQALIVKRYSFLARCYLQYCAILSQLGKHQNALENSKKAADMMRKFFKVSFEFCSEFRKKAESSANSSQTSSKPTRAFSQKFSNQKDSESTNDSGQRQLFQMKDEITFAKLVVEQGYDVLQDMANLAPMEDMSVDEKEQFNEAKKQLYYWRNNPENNEKHFRKGLKVSQTPKQDDFRQLVINQFYLYRSLLGVQNVQEWIENFNIGSIMHMVPMSYQEFSSYGEMIYEISKRILLEKIIYLSIAYFTIATEFRFVEIEKAKQNGVNDKEIETEEFKMSELYHLKAIELACKYITCSSPYINHLITSYQKHYNQNLDIIVIIFIFFKFKPEESFNSQLEINCDKKTEKKIIKQVLIQNQTKIKQENESEQQGVSTTNEFQSIKQLSSPTSKVLHSFMNQQPSQPISKLKMNEIKLNNDILEQMLSYKRKLNHSPTNSKPLLKTMPTKRDSSPGLLGSSNNVVPALTFLQNAIIYNQQQQPNLKEKQNYSSNQILEKTMINNLVKKDNSLLVSHQRNSYVNKQNIATVYSSNKNGKNSLNNLLKTRPPTQSNQRNPDYNNLLQNGISIHSSFKVQISERLSQPDQCRTERSREYNDLRLQSQVNSRSSEDKSKKQLQSRKPASTQKLTASQIPIEQQKLSKAKCPSTTKLLNNCQKITDMMPKQMLRRINE